jgi:hypothetical protein
MHDECTFRDTSSSHHHHHHRGQRFSPSPRFGHIASRRCIPPQVTESKTQSCSIKIAVSSLFCHWFSEERISSIELNAILAIMFAPIPWLQDFLSMNPRDVNIGFGDSSMREKEQLRTEVEQSESMKYNSRRQKMKNEPVKMFGNDVINTNAFQPFTLQK